MLRKACSENNADRNWKKSAHRCVEDRNVYGSVRDKMVGMYLQQGLKEDNVVCLLTLRFRGRLLFRK